jgi:hypothetical protein
VWEWRWEAAAPWAILLYAAVTLTAWVAYRLRRSSYLALALLAGWLALVRFVLEIDKGAGGLLVVAVSSLGVLWFIRRVHRRMKEEF